MNKLPYILYLLSIAAACNIAPVEQLLQNTHAESKNTKALLSNARKAIATHAQIATTLWNKCSGQRTIPKADTLKLSYYYEHIIDPIITLISDSFYHYANALQPLGFKNLSSLIRCSIKKEHMGDCSVTWAPPQSSSHTLDGRSPSAHTPEKAKITLNFQFPQAIPQLCLFSPTTEPLLLARLIGVVGHELGHVFNEYNQGASLKNHFSALVSTMRPAMIAGIGSAVIVLQHLLPFMDEHPLLRVGTVGISATIASILFFTAVKRAQAHRRENDADALALLVAPRSIMYGLIVFFAEHRCDYYYQENDRWYSQCKTALQEWCIPGYDAHPSDLDRLQQVTHLILKAELPKQRTRALQGLEFVTQETIKQYPSMYQNSLPAQQAAQSAQRDINTIFKQMRTQYRLR